MFEISEDSDAVFHEDSEYALGLMIRANNDDKSSIFRNCCKFFLQKKFKKNENVKTVFRPYLNENMIKFKK
jgi:hypothetical protein